MKKLTAFIVLLVLTAIDSVGSVSVAANTEGTAKNTGVITVAKSQYFFKSETQTYNYRFKKDFASSEDVTAPVSSDDAPAVSTDSADTASVRKRDHARYLATSSFTTNNRKGDVTSSDTADNADE